jgi:membrane-bound serine protease (ClpP class)
VGLGVKAQRKRPVSGVEGLINTVGVARSPIRLTGKVFVHGELWEARSKESIAEGDPVRVIGIEGLRLEVLKEDRS